MNKNKKGLPSTKKNGADLSSTKKNGADLSSTKKNGAGFTLIELLVVVAIIGMLSSIVLVSIGPVQKDARDSRAKADLQQIATALGLYYLANDRYPSGIPAAIADIPAASAILSPYLNPIPTSSKKVYRWFSTDTADTGQLFCITVQLEVPSSTTYFYVSQRGSGTAATATCP